MSFRFLAEREFLSLNERVVPALFAFKTVKVKLAEHDTAQGKKKKKTTQYAALCAVCFKNILSVVANLCISNPTPTDALL